MLQIFIAMYTVTLLVSRRPPEGPVQETIVENPCVCCRVDISDTLMYVYEMLGTQVLSKLYDELGRLLMEPERMAPWQVCSGDPGGGLA